MEGINEAEDWLLRGSLFALLDLTIFVILASSILFSLSISVHLSIQVKLPKLTFYKELFVAFVYGVLYCEGESVINKFGCITNFKLVM
jgi:hypothetical protein